MKKYQSSRAGFTLVEIAIVLAIIALIIGGVLTGQTLQRQSQITSAMMDSQRYVTAAQNFQQKYNALPGDFANAPTLWGTMGGGACPPVNGSSTQSGTQTCPGDGNGQVVDLATAPAAAHNTYSNTYESFLFWQHLADAQMIQGTYTGIPGAAGTLDHVLGSNCPKTRMDNAGFGVAFEGVVSAAQTDTNFYPTTANTSINYGHVFYLGGYKSNNYPVAATFTATEAAAIDTKYDDGLPSSGNILTWVYSTGYTGTTCISSATPPVYLTTNTPACSLIIITGF